MCMQIIFCLASTKSVKTPHNVMSLCCSRELFWSSLTHRDHGPEKTDVRKHNPEKHSHAHCLSLEKKNPTLNDHEHSRYSWQKKKIENRKRNKKNKKEETRTNLLYKQIKIKVKLNKFALKAVFKKKNQ